MKRCFKSYKFMVLALMMFSFICIPSIILNPLETGKREENIGTVSKMGKYISIDWYIDSSYISNMKKWAQYPILKEISVRTGVEPNITVSIKNKNEKLDLMIASDNFPDIITLDMDDLNVKKLLRLKKLYSFDELIDLYVPQFKKEITDELWKDTVYDDGKLYGLPGDYIPRSTYRCKTGMGLYTYNVRKDMYIQLGSPDMSTPEGFVKALRLFKEKYPSIGGKPSIPVSLFGSIDNQIEIIERSFGVKEYYEAKNKDILIKYENPDYIRIIQFLNNLYREGLMDPLAFIKKKQLISEDINSGRIFAIPTKYTELASINSSLNIKGVESKYIAVEPMKAVQNVTFPGRNRFGTTFTMIPLASEKPESAIKFIRFLWSKEGNLLLKYGQEGVDYIIDRGIIKRSKQVQAQMRIDLEGFVQSTGLSAFPLLFYPYEGTVFTNELQGDDLLAQKTADKYFDESNKYLKSLNPDYGLPIGRLKSKLEDIIQRDYPLAIMSESEDAAIMTFRSMILKLEQSGLEKLEFYWTERNKFNRSRRY